MKSKRSVIYISFTFALTWGFYWLLVFLTQKDLLQLEDPLGQVLYIIGGSAPTVGAYVAILNTKNIGRLKEFHHRLLKLTISYKWYLFSLLTPILLGVTGVLIGYLFNNQILNNNPVEPIYVFIPALLSSIIFGGIEELGWRGVLLPELLKKHNYITSTVIVGVIWGIWHLPLFFIPGTGQYGTSVLIYILSAVGVSFFLSYIYVNTNSLIPCILFHASLNAVGIMGLDLPGEYTVAYSIHSLLIMLIGFFLMLFLKKNKINN